MLRVKVTLRKMTDDIKGSGISDEDIKAIREDALKWHNIFRSWHKDTPPMTLNEEMNKDAQAHAETLIRKGGLRHSKRAHSSDGENLHSMGGNDAKTAGEVASKAWWAEFCDTNKWPRGNLNRFTQLVWKDSVQLGIGVAKGNSRVVVVGRYRTGGNLNGEEMRKMNVMPLACDEAQVCDGMELKKPTEESGQCGVGSVKGSLFLVIVTMFFGKMVVGASINV